MTTGGTELTELESRTPGLDGRRRRESLRVVVMLLDAMVLTVSVLVAYQLRMRIGAGRSPIWTFTREGLVLLFSPAIWLVSLQRFGSYRHEYLNATADAFRRFAGGIALGVLVIGFISFTFELNLSRRIILISGVSALVLGGAYRQALRGYVARGFAEGTLRQRALIVGFNQDALQTARAIGSSPRSGYEVAGFLVDLEAGVPAPAGMDTEVLGTVDDLEAVLREHGIGLVLVATTGVTPGTLQRLTVRLEGSPIGLAIAPSLFQVVSRRVVVESVSNVPILHLDRIQLDRWKAFLKRSLDVATTVVLGLFTLPLWGAAAAAIKLQDGGPVFFRQERVGKDGRSFEVLKFRTMVVDAEERLAEIQHLNEVDDGFFKIRQDPRVTPVGGSLRKWSIDELPQLWNVLRGDMSMVGPRPPIPSEVARYSDWELRRLRVRPGITGIWQTSGRSDVPFDEAIRMDLFYIENWSLGTDLFLLMKTVLAVLRREGAY